MSNVQSSQERLYYKPTGSDVYINIGDFITSLSQEKSYNEEEFNFVSKKTSTKIKTYTGASISFEAILDLSDKFINDVDLNYTLNKTDQKYPMMLVREYRCKATDKTMFFASTFEGTVNGSSKTVEGGATIKVPGTISIGDETFGYVDTTTGYNDEADTYTSSAFTASDMGVDANLPVDINSVASGISTQNDPKTTKIYGSADNKTSEA